MSRPRSAYPGAPALLSALLLLTWACKKDGGVPAYIRLDDIALSTSPAEGTASHNISDVWVYADDELLGVWEANGRIPVLREGSTDIKLIAGVRRNGISDDRQQYPFFATFQTDLDLVPEQTVTLSPTFSYFDDLTFWIEDFDGNGFAFERDPVSDTLLYVWDTLSHPVEEIFEGRASGAFFLDAQRPFFSYVYDGDPFNMAIDAPVYLEMNYRSNARMLIGVEVVSDGGGVERIPYLYVSPSNQDDPSMPWKKIYIDLRQAWAYPGAYDKRFYIECVLPSGQSTAQVYLDNIKVVQR
jgi:hypothetical protein